MPKINIHPEMSEINIICSTCNSEMKTLSTLNKSKINIDSCSSCHPFYTGKQTFSRKGRVEKFKSKLAKKVVK